MSIQQLTPPEAHTAMQAAPDAVFLDVRSQGEFVAGHPAGALNVPIVFFDMDSGTREPNLDFVGIVEALVPDKNGPIFLSCLAGGRSQSAAEILAQVGYTNLTNVQGGWGGSGGTPGWQAAGLPVSDDNGDGIGFESLKAKATQA
jgi:rhodanese-related sulfurtransferase